MNMGIGKKSLAHPCAILGLGQDRVVLQIEVSLKPPAMRHGLLFNGEFAFAGKAMDRERDCWEVSLFLPVFFWVGAGERPDFFDGSFPPTAFDALQKIRKCDCLLGFLFEGIRE